VDTGTAQGGVAALLGGGQAVAMPAWDQLRIVPGGISADDLQLNLSGQFTNRGTLDVTRDLVIRAAQGIDNFGAAIRAGGSASLSGASLDNTGARIEAGSLLAAIDGDITNDRGSITAQDGAYLQAGGSITASEGSFTSTAGKIVLDAGGNIALAASTARGQQGAGLYAGGDIALTALARQDASSSSEDLYTTVRYEMGELGTVHEEQVKIGTRSSSSQSLTHSASTVDGGAGSTIVRAQGDVNATGSTIAAGQDVRIEGASVRIASVIDQHSSHDEEHRGNYDHALFQHDETLVGGEVAAGANLSIVATGQTNDQADAGKGDITLKGATLINFCSQSGISFNASASQAKGSGEGESLTYSNTQVKAGGSASIHSGQNTTLKGATITADSIAADVGGNLAIESLQDSSEYQASSKSSGFGLSLCIPPWCIDVPVSGFSLSSGRTHIDSNYQSVDKQSALRAGDGGFAVNVQGDTTLKGGAITSTQAAIDENKNNFQTGGTLTTSDIDNSAAYDAGGYQVNATASAHLGDQSTAQTPEQQRAAQAPTSHGTSAARVACAVD
jgi:adhesin HecA-like repeat protein